MEEIKFFPKRKKQVSIFFRLSNGNGNGNGKPSFSLSCGARLLIKPSMADPSIGLMTLFFRFDQSDSNSSLKFRQLAAKWLKSSVFDFQMKQSTISIWEPWNSVIKTKLPNESYLSVANASLSHDIVQNCHGKILERQLFAKFVWWWFSQ